MANSSFASLLTAATVTVAATRDIIVIVGEIPFELFEIAKREGVGRIGGIIS